MTCKVCARPLYFDIEGNPCARCVHFAEQRIIRILSLGNVLTPFRRVVRVVAPIKVVSPRVELYSWR